MKWFVLAFLLLCAPASAQEMVIGSGVFAVKQQTSSTYTGPGDVVSFTFWAGFRAYSASVASGGTQKVINIRNTGTSETCDVLVATNGGLASTVSNCSGSSSGTALSTFCGTCAVTKFYDQTGGARDVSQGTAAAQAGLTLSCQNSLPCADSPTSSNQGAYQSAANFTPATGTVSIEAVANNVAGGGQQEWVEQNNGNNVVGNAGALGTWQVIATSSINATASSNAFHFAGAVVSGASSSIQIDGSAPVSGSLTGTTTAGRIVFLTAQGTNHSQFIEGGFADNTAWTGTNVNNLHTNVKNYWATP